MTAALTAALMLMTVVVGGTAATAATNTADVVHFVVDVSGSMGGSKIAEAIEAVQVTAGAIDDDVALGLRSYAGGCDQSGVDPVVEIAVDNDQQIIDGAASLRAGGGTPTTAALAEGITDVREFDTSGAQRLVLLTDGDTGCGISVCDFIAGQDLSDLELTLYTVGLQVSSPAAADLTCAAELTGGQYVAAADPQDLAEILTDITADQDQDGDGLPDSWEEGLGRWLGGDLYDPWLVDNGASPLRKDLFVYLREERGAQLKQESIDLVVEAFADAPIPNPDGSTGISLHVVRGPLLTAQESDDLKTTDDKGEIVPDWDAISEDVGNLTINYARGAYAVLWDDFDAGGMADDIPGQLMVLNACGANRDLKRGTWPFKRPADRCPVNAERAANNFMHELGHTLGLWHGGGAIDGCPMPDSVEELPEEPEDAGDLPDCVADALSPYKPNHLSVMSYLHFKAVPGVGIDFSSWGPDDIYVLDERSLSEYDGVDSPTGALPGSYQAPFFCADGTLKKANAYEWTDWNCSGPGNSGVEAGRISANLDFYAELHGSSDPSPWMAALLGREQVLRPFDEWAWIAANSRRALGAGVIGEDTIGYDPGPGWA